MDRETIIQLLNDYKQNRTDFIIHYKYLDDDNKVSIDTIECGWLWTTLTYKDNCIYDINVYDKGWDDDVSFKIEDIYKLEIDAPVINNFSHSDFNSIVDDLYTSFCNNWDNSDYDKAELIMRHLHNTIKERVQVIRKHN
tara:strand:- start:62 stop:478 length:417 start_codon:yes stop_codon:yes gene_type:complete